MRKKAIEWLRTHWMFYLFGLVLILGIKYYYSKADSDALQWILAPTAWWVRTLCGIPFEYVPGAGYINHSYQFLIAPSCSGVQFIMIAIATLIFTFVHRMKTFKKSVLWTAFSVGVSYPFTVFINGFRIVCSIYLPLWFHRLGVEAGWLTPERLHTMTGIAVYFTSLFFLYRIADYVSREFSGAQRAGGASSAAGALDDASAMPAAGVPGHLVRKLLGRCLPPVFWYFAIVLGIPFLNRAYAGEGSRFTEYAMLMAGVCLTVLGLIGLVTVAGRRLGRGRR